jgi:Xaa-Pro aminopeptidase
MRGKILKICNIYDNYKSTGILFTNAKETFYITGALFDGFWILIVKSKVYVICSKMVAHQVQEYFREQGAYIDVIIEPYFYKAVLEILKQSKIKVLLVDPRYMNAADFVLICENLKKEKISIIKGISVLDSIKLVKDTAEIENIRKSCEIVSKVCDMVRKELKPGLSELDIHYKVLGLFAENKVSESFIPIVASGANTANPHHRSSDRKIVENDIVMMDIGCIYNGYCSDLTRTYFLGKIERRRRKVWDIVKNAQNAVLDGIKAGLPVSYADKTARSVIDMAGYKDNFIHTTGHGIGVEIHEMPSLTLNAEGIFLAHMAITVEPGIYIDGEFGVRIEDTILVEEDGCEVLTSATY